MKIIGSTVGMGLPKPNLMQSNPKKGDYVKGKEEFLDSINGNEVLWEGSMTFEEVGTSGKYIEHIWSDHKPPAKKFYAGEKIRLTVDGVSKVYTAAENADWAKMAWIGNYYVSNSAPSGTVDTGDDFHILMWVDTTLDYWEYMCFARNPGTYQVKLERITEQVDAVTLDAAKEYTDSQRIAWTEMEEIDIIPTQELTAENFGDGIGVFCLDSLTVPGAKPPDKITFLLDDVTYDLERIPTEALPETTGTYGNGAFWDESIPLNDYKFGIMLSGDGVFVLLIADPDDPGSVAKPGDTRTIGLSCMVETVHRLPQKYLPENYGGMRVYEVDLENPDNTIMDEIVAGRKPVILTFTELEDGYTVTAVANVKYKEDNGPNIACNVADRVYRWIGGLDGWIGCTYKLDNMTNV